MAQYVCTMCGFTYDEARGRPAQGFAPGTPWEQVPADWKCPMCGSPHTLFRERRPL